MLVTCIGHNFVFGVCKLVDGYGFLGDWCSVGGLVCFNVWLNYVFNEV